jgi:hypothetical protein
MKAWAVARAGFQTTSQYTWTQRLLSSLATFSISSGLIRPRRDLNALHQALIRRRTARFFGGPLEIWASPPLREVDEVAARIKKQLGF